MTGIAKNTILFPSKDGMKRLVSDSLGAPLVMPGMELSIVRLRTFLLRSGRVAGICVFFK